nr:hypothetical protein [Neoroseomonas lacus]
MVRGAGDTDHADLGRAELDMQVAAERCLELQAANAEARDELRDLLGRRAAADDFGAPGDQAAQRQSPAVIAVKAEAMEKDAPLARQDLGLVDHHRLGRDHQLGAAGGIRDADHQLRPAGRRRNIWCSDGRFDIRPDQRRTAQRVGRRHADHGDQAEASGEILAQWRRVARQQRHWPAAEADACQCRPDIGPVIGEGDTDRIARSEPGAGELRGHGPHLPHQRGIAQRCAVKNAGGQVRRTSRSRLDRCRDDRRACGVCV